MVTAQTYLFLSGTVGPIRKIETFSHQDQFPFLILLTFIYLSDLSKIKFSKANSEDIQDHQVEDQDGDLLEVRYLHRDHQDLDNCFSRIKSNKNTLYTCYP